MVERVLLASPRGWCAGVERAVATVEQALGLWGAPLYVRKQIVHNGHVVRRLERLGAVFVESEEEVPEGATLIFSAHGVAPAVVENARRRGLRIVDATCPLVTKVHAEARHYAAKGYTVIVIGHGGHEEVEGTIGEAPDSCLLIESVADAEALELARPELLAYVTQTTLSVDETGDIVAVLRRRFPQIVGPRKEDICYATTNRQRAVKAMLGAIDILLVVGSRNSSNSNRLAEVARAGCVPAYLIDDESWIVESWLVGVSTVGLTSGASTPESLVGRVCAWFRERGVRDIAFHSAVDEMVDFKLPAALRGEVGTG